MRQELAYCLSVASLDRPETIETVITRHQRRNSTVKKENSEFHVMSKINPPQKYTMSEAVEIALHPAQWKSKSWLSQDPIGS